MAEIDKEIMLTSLEIQIEELLSKIYYFNNNKNIFNINNYYNNLKNNNIQNNNFDNIIMVKENNFQINNNYNND